MGDTNNNVLKSSQTINYLLQKKTISVTMEKKINVAVVGNPNSGKSTLINGIAGTRLHVGNWPGVTVEKREVSLTYHEKEIKLIDLPGIYSLSPYTEDEMVTRIHLVYEKPDVVINVIDSTNLERNLYLTVQLMELGIPIVAALNIYDELLKKGYKIDLRKLEKLSGIKVIPTIAVKKTGLNELFDTVIKVSEKPTIYDPEPLHYENDIENAVEIINSYINENRMLIGDGYPKRWFLFKLLEGDKHLLTKCRRYNNNFYKIENIIKDQRKKCGKDIESVMANTRYKQASYISYEVLTFPKKRKTDITERIDKFLLHKFLSIPLFFAIMWAVFKLTFDFSAPFVGLVEKIVTGPVTEISLALLGLVNTPTWIYSLVTDGIIAGVGFVLSFVPIIFTMMFFITFLEGSGYMARAAFIMDRAMHSFGLHGKAFIPLLLGFGCNVPAIYATRVLENRTDRILTTLLIPLMSCGARLPIYTIIIGTLFSKHSGTILWSLYTMGIILAVIIGIILRKTLFRSKIQETFIMELPPYRMPSFNNLMIHTWEKGKHFLTKAGTYIFAVSIIVWILLSLPWGVENKKDSLLGMVGQTVAPVLRPLGFGNWESASSLITGIIAKEIVISTMAEVYITSDENNQIDDKSFSIVDSLNIIKSSFAETLKKSGINLFTTFKIQSISANKFFSKENYDQESFSATIQNTFTPLSAYSFMVFVLLYSPCIVTGIAMKQEFGTWKWFGITFGYEFVLAWTVSFAIYQAGKLLGIGV